MARRKALELVVEIDPSVELARMLAEAAAPPLALVDPRMLPVRWSRLKHFAVSASHYHHACQSDGDDTISKRIGSGAHAITFDQPWVLWPGKKRNGGAWDEFRKKHEGKVILNRTELAHARGVADAIRRNARACELLFDGTTIEQTLEWQYREVGEPRRCSSRPDAFGRHHVAELKSTRSAQPKWFARDAQRLQYHGQLGFYGDALLDLGLSTASEMYIIAVESKPPHPVQVYRLTDHAVMRGRLLVRAHMERLAVCEASGVWPAYSLADVTLDVTDDMDEMPLDDEPAVAADEGGVPASDW